MTVAIGHNGMSRDEWLFTILRSGQVTRIAQHLALVIYHLSDPSTNIARLSTRDLEGMTGWGRTTIRHHIDELDTFIAVTWGQGRAKALFELQGVIAEAVKPLKAARDQAKNGQPSGHNDVPQGNLVVSQVATTSDEDGVCGQPGGQNEQSLVAAWSATSGNGDLRGHNSGHLNNGHAATTENGQTGGQNGTAKRLAKWPQNENGGDYRGGILDSESSHHQQGYIHHGRARSRVRETDETPPEYIVHPDGSFSGTAFEHFTATEVATMRSVFPALDIIPELINADKFLARAFEKDGTPFDSPERHARLHAFLAKKNRDSFAMIQAMQATPKAPPQLMPGVLAEGYIVTDRLRIELVNGVRAEWVDRFGGAEDVLDDTLIELSGKIKPNSPTPIVAQIDSYLARVARDRRDSDKRYQKATADREKTRSRQSADKGGIPQESELERTKRLLAGG